MTGQTYFANLFGDLSLPVLVCEDEAGFPVTYVNIRAGLLFSPTHSVEQLREEQSHGNLSEVLRFVALEEYVSLVHTMENLGHVDSYRVKIVTFDGKVIPVSLSANRAAVEGKSYVVFYLTQLQREAEEELVGFDGRLMAIVNTAYAGENVDATIQMLLALAGEQTNVSRTYIFEEISPTSTRNTYEWCARGIPPAIDDLQDLKKADYNYDVIVGSGMYIAEDISKLPEADRAILEAQGIKSLCILPFYDSGKAMGYVGFDDCEKSRKWSTEEIQFLRSVSVLLTTLIKRRNAEEAVNRYHSMMELISDNSQEVFYANSLDDYTIQFASKSLADALGTTVGEMMGKKCHEIIHEYREGPCPFCPIPKIQLKSGEEYSEPYIWEHKNARTGKTYFAKDSIVRWVDGGYVHVETAMDITPRIMYEEQLRKLASTDSMTGVNNREWGGRILEEMLSAGSRPGCLCFVDLDGLKGVNDRYGHGAGDDFLMKAVDAMKRHLGSNEFICRWGGDEFLLLIWGDETHGRAVLESVLEDLHQINLKEKHPYALTFSYGVVQFSPGLETSLDSLVTEADERMYQHKIEKLGKNKKRRRDDFIESEGIL